MKKFFVTLITILLAATIIGCSSNDSGASDNGNDSSGDSNDNKDKPTLTFGVTPWTSTVPPTKIAGKILENMGYNVKEKDAEPGAIYAGMSNGDVNIFMDSWFPNQKQYVNKYSDSIEDISVSYNDANSGMVVPKYMENIENVGDLKGKEDMVNNEMYGIGSGDPAMDNMKKVIDAYDLDIELINSSEAAMLASAEDKMENEEPVLFYGWRPHTMFQKFDLKILPNKEAPGDFFRGSSIHVIAHNELKEYAPEAYDFLSNWRISIDELEKMVAEIDGGANPDKVAQTWIDNHQDKVDKMMGKE